MERKINNLSICYTLFLILLFFSGALSGALSEIVKYLAYILPFALGLFFIREEASFDKNYITLDKEKVKFTLPIIFPTVVSVMLVSVITSLLVKLVGGKENNVDVGNELIPALISHALVPALFEEVLFRYLPMRMLKNHSGKLVILVSSVFFALIHHSLYSIPYAFVAGVVFMAIDLACDSVIPSFLLHFINNAISVGMLVYKDNPLFAPTILTLVVALALVSLIYIAFNKTKYIDRLAKVLEGEEMISLTPSAIVFGVACIFIAIVSIL